MKQFNLVVLLLAIFSIRATAQNIPPATDGVLQQYIDNLPSTQQFVNIPISNGAIDQWAQNYLLGQAPAGYSFALAYSRQSPDGIYYTYDLNYLGSPVFGRTAKIFTDNKATIRYVYHNLSDFAAGVSTLPGDKTIDNYFAQTFPALALKEKGALWVYDGEQLVPAFYLTLKNEANYNIEKRIFNIQGNLLYTYPLYSSYAATDTPAYAYVYNPDPLTTSHQPYGGNYSNNNGQDNAELRAEQQKKSINGTMQGDSVILANSRFVVQELSGPIWPETKVHINDTFKFGRDEHSFCDVNAFYHLNTYYDYVHSIGYTSLPGFFIQVDAHAFNGAENSRFTPGDVPPSLQFGDGGIPDAEDAEVVIHEFGHSLSYGASPNTAIGTERLAIDEGLGDYFASSHTKPIDDYNWTKVFAWDGNNGNWKGRTVNYQKKYPAELSNNRWNDGQFWSTSFMRLFDDVGKDVADKLMLETLYRLASNITMTQLAQAVLQVDTIKYAGAHHDNIVCAFAYTGILQGLPTGCASSTGPEIANTKQNNSALYNTWAFATGSGDATVVFTKKGVYKVSVSDVNGRILQQQTIEGIENASISSQNLASGVYFVHITSQDGLTEAFKLIRY